MILSWWTSPPRRSWRPPAAPAPACPALFRSPTEKEIVTILRAVHKYKDSREQFEMRTHKRLIDILRPSNKTVEALMGLELPPPAWKSKSSCNRLSGSIREVKLTGTAKQTGRMSCTGSRRERRLRKAPGRVNQ